MLKSLRETLRARRQNLPPAQRMAAALAMAAHLAKWPEWARARRIGGYWAVRGELPLLGLLPILPAGATYCLPVLHAGQTLRFAPWQAGAPVAANRFGIPEPADRTGALAPAQMDIVLLPLLGYTRRGDRLGTGGGWYDRSFAFRAASPAPPWLVGIGYACQQLDADWIAQPWDVPLDAIVNERELIACAR